MIHTFPLRRIAGLHKAAYETITIDLPDDFSQADVDRLYRWLRTLPHDDPKPLTTVHDELTMAWSRNAGLANALEAIANEVGVETPNGVREDSWALAKEINRRITHLRTTRNVPTPAEKDEDDRIDKAVERLVFMLHIYGGYTIGTRGPAGCIIDAIEALSPRVAQELRDGDAHDVYARRWGDSEPEQSDEPRSEE